MAYKEDISAERIVLKPLGNTIISYEIDPVEGRSFRDVKDKIEDSIKPYKELGITILETRISGTFAVDSKTYLPTEQQYIRNKIEDIKSMGGDLKVNFLDNGLTLYGKQKIDNLDIYDSLISPKKILTSKIKVYLIVNETLNELPKGIKSYNVTNIVTLK